MYIYIYVYLSLKELGTLFGALWDSIGEGSALGPESREPPHVVGIQQEYEDPGRYSPIIFLLYSWGSLLCCHLLRNSCLFLLEYNHKERIKIMFLLEV